MKKWIYSGMLAMTPAIACYGDAYSNLSTIKHLTIGGNMARVALYDSAGGYETCSTERPMYAFDVSVPGGREMYATLLAAKLAGEKVFLQSSGCYGTYSKVAHVYVCETMWCS